MNHDRHETSQRETRAGRRTLTVGVALALLLTLPGPRAEAKRPTERLRAQNEERPQHRTKAHRGGQSGGGDREASDRRRRNNPKVRDHRGETSYPEPSHGEPRPTLQVENWIGRESAPDEISEPPRLGTRSRNVIPQPLTVVLAGTLELGGNAYGRRNAPKNVLLIADRLRLTDRVRFRLRAGRRSSLLGRSGGHLALFAREIVCEEGGRLVFESTSRFGDGHGGDLVLAAERYLLGDRQVTGEVFADSGCIEVHLSGGTPSAKQREAGMSAGEPGRVRLFDHLAEAASELEKDDLEHYGYGGHQPVISRFARYALSKWVVEILPEAIADVHEAEITESRAEAVRALRRAGALIDSSRFPVVRAELAREDGLDAEAAYDTYHDRMRELRELTRDLEDTLWEDTVSVEMPGGIPRELRVFTEGGNLEARLAPTGALIQPKEVDGRRVAGVMTFDPENPNEMDLVLRVELTVDPLLEARAARKLEERGEDYGGVFSNWELSPRPIEAQGVLDSEIDMFSSKRGARIRLTLDPDLSTLVLADLSDRAGLPLKLDWRYAEDQDQEGTLDVAVSLLRRVDPEIELDREGRVANTGDTELTVGYVQLADDRFEPFSDGVTVPPGETVELPVSDAVDLREARVPAEAVEYTGTDPYRFGQEFQVVNGEGVVETISVANRLGHDPRRGGGLKYVEIDLEYRNGGEGTSVGPYRLAPVGADGDQVQVSFVKTGPGTREVEVSGTAYYEGGSRQTLDPATFDTLSIKITEEMLPVLD